MNIGHRLDRELVMHLNTSSPIYLHLLQNLSLIALSLLFAPICTLVTICSYIVAPYTTTAKHIKHKQQRWRALTSSVLQPRVILVTGVGMSKGLLLCRAFYREGHIVIGADFEPYGVPVCGRFSTALKMFYRLSKPVPGPGGCDVYCESLINIIKKENVDLWVSCSGVASAVEDAHAAEVVEKQTRCKVIQFGVEVTETLHEKHSFIQQTQRFGLNVPETHHITSVHDAMIQLDPGKSHSPGKRFIMKSIGLDDSIRADMTILPRPSIEEMENYLLRLRLSTSRPFVLQQYISGYEYCTHSLVIRGRVTVFVACPSAELLMHYEALPRESELSSAMQKYTEIYAEKMGCVTGHFSLDFILDKDALGLDLLKRLYPIECNPRAHTAVVLLEHESEAMVEAYLSVLKDDVSGHRSIVIPLVNTGYYWIGHDLTTLVVVPLLSLLSLRSDLATCFREWRSFLNHFCNWKDGSYEVWDPWPFWWLYIIYWPGMFLSVVFTRKWWSRCNVSTTKIFRC